MKTLAQRDVPVIIAGSYDISHRGASRTISRRLGKCGWIKPAYLTCGAGKPGIERHPLHQICAPRKRRDPGTGWTNGLRTRHCHRLPGLNPGDAAQFPAVQNCSFDALSILEKGNVVSVSNHEDMPPVKA